MCPSHESDISTDKRAGVWLGLSVPSLVMGQLTVKERDNSSIGTDFFT